MSAGELVPESSQESSARKMPEYREQLPFRYHLSLSLSHDQIPPDEITSEMGLLPDRTEFKENPSKAWNSLDGTLAGMNKTQGLSRKNRWFYRFEPTDLAEPLTDCLSRFIKCLKPKTPFIERFSSSNGRAALNLVLYPPQDEPAPFDPNLLNSLRSLGLIVYLEIGNEHKTARPMPERH